MKTNYVFILAFFAISLMSFQLKAQTVVNGIAYNVVEGVAEVAALPDGVKYTGTLTIPANVTISGTEYAVKKIGNGSLRDAPALTSVIIPEGLEVIGNSSFATCTGITSIVLPSTVNSIEDWAFYDCSNLAQINIPDGITAITEHTFQQTGLTGITLPASVTSLKTCAFQNANKLASINLENITEIAAWALYGTAITTAEVSNVFTIGSEAFRVCPNLETVILNNVTSIGRWSFEGCTKLNSVTMNGVETIEMGAFSGCTGLTSLTIPNTVIYIADWSLEKTGLTEIFVSWEAPDETVYIEENAFGAGDGKINITWKVPENLLSVYGDTWLGYPVVADGASGLGNTVFEKANAYYANGNLNMIDLAGYTVSIVTLDGRSIAQYLVSESSSVVPVSLPSGVYLVNAVNGSNRAVVKLFVK